MNKESKEKIGIYLTYLIPSILVWGVVMYKYGGEMQWFLCAISLLLIPIGILISHSFLYSVYDNFLWMFEKHAGITSFWVTLIIVVAFFVLEILWGGSPSKDVTIDDYMFYNRIP